MTDKLNVLFPDAVFEPHVAEQVDLNLAAGLMFTERAANPLLDPQFCLDWVNHLARECKVDYTYGGYMENRSFMWRGSYLKPEASIHLGIDVNMPFGSEVRCPIPFKVEDVFQDPDQNGGWGGRVLIRTEYGLVIFAHLCLDGLMYGEQMRVGDEHPANTALGWIDCSDDNGGWFPHLHLQGIKDIAQMEGIDGYAAYSPDLVDLYPNPLPLLGIHL
jgi:hypothetical protein